MINERTRRLLEKLPHDFEAAIIGTEVSRFYLLDFDAGDAGHLVLLPHKLVYIIDSRYIEIARREITCAEVLLEEDALAQMAEVLQKAGAKRVLLENGISIARWGQLKDKIQGVEFDIGSTLSNAIVSLREIKDAEELARMQKAQDITDACFEHILPFFKEGVREVDLMLEMEHFMRSHGAEKVAFDTIVVAGANSSLPHGVPGENRLKAGDLITMDYGAKVRGYCTDMTRTVALGTPGEEQRKVYDTVLKAHLAGIEAAAAGKMGSQVDKVARDIINAAGYEGRFGHGLGHAVGIEIHEAPRFSPKCHDVIRPGMMMTVEPGIYLPGQFGCRIEDTVRITEDGCVPLPKARKELVVL